LVVVEAGKGGVPKFNAADGEDHSGDDAFSAY